MSNPLQLPQPNMAPGGYLPPGPTQPSAIDNFLQMFLESKQLKGNLDAQKAQTAIASARLGVEKERVKLDQEKEKTRQTEQDAQGKGLQKLLDALGPGIEAYSQSHPEVVQGLMGGGQQGAQGGGGGQPMGQPAQNPMVPPEASQGPMQAFSRIVGSLPPGAVPEFVQHFRGIAEGAQKKVDEATAFNEAARLTGGLLTPQQNDQFMLARTLFQAGAPKEMWEAMMPQAQIDLVKGLEEVRGIKDKREANKVATAQLAKLGLIPKSGHSEYVVDNAPKMLVDYIADVRKDARAAALVRAKEERDTSVKGLEGTALELAVMNPDWSPAQIKAAIKATPAYANLPNGVIAKVALEAPKQAQNLTAPANETQAKMRVVYGPGRAALATVNAMDAKGESLGGLARLAQIDEQQTGLLGSSIGTAAGGIMAGGPTAGIGAIPGAIAGGAIGGGVGLMAAPLLRTAGRRLMSADQQRLWTAGQSLAAMIYRPETGAQASLGEVRQTIERYFPLNTDKPPAKAFKRTLRDELDKTAASVSGLPQQLAQPIIDALLSKHEQRLSQRVSPQIGAKTGGGGADW